jgi:NitT/TauT family transport system permease protein
MTKAVLSRSRGWWLADGATAMVIIVWFAASRKLPEFVLPGPIPVAERLFALFAEPSFLVHTLASTSRVVASVAIALCLGGCIAVLHRRVSALDWVIRGSVQPFLSGFPSIGWAILASLWFKVGSLSIVFVQVAILLPFCFINIAEGLRQIEPDLPEMAYSFTRKRSRVFLAISIPLLLPYLLGAVRISYGIAWKIALVSELLGSTSGLGYLMLQAQGSADMTTVIATCFAIVILYVAGERLVLAPLTRRYSQF